MRSPTLLSVSPRSQLTSPCVRAQKTAYTALIVDPTSIILVAISVHLLDVKMVIRVQRITTGASVDAIWLPRRRHI